MEVITEDSDLVVDGGKTVSLPYKVRNKRYIVYTFGHISLVARKQQYIVEVEIACFQHTHYLHPTSWFAVERNAC